MYIPEKPSTQIIIFGSAVPCKNIMREIHIKLKRLKRLFMKRNVRSRTYLRLKWSLVCVELRPFLCGVPFSR